MNNYEIALDDISTGDLPSKILTYFFYGDCYDDLDTALKNAGMDDAVLNMNPCRPGLDLMMEEESWGANRLNSDYEKVWDWWYVTLRVS
jgi:hypothetical protein